MLPHVAGTPNLNDALVWIASTMRDQGLNVTMEPVSGIVNWQRGEESLEMLQPRHQKALNILGLGTSVGGDVTAPVRIYSY